MATQGGSKTADQKVAQVTAIPNSLTIEPFDARITTWRRWLQRLQGAFMIFKIQNEERVTYLLHYVGPAAFDVLCDRLDPEDPFLQAFERLTEILKEYFEPPPLEIAENFRFHQRRQESGEGVQQFAAALHKLSIHCKFGEYLKTALRNQLVFGLASKKIQTRLLEKKDLTYEEALKIATTMELSEKGSASLQGRGTQPSAQVDVVQAGGSTQKKPWPNKTRSGQRDKSTNEFSNYPNNRCKNTFGYRSNNHHRVGNVNNAKGIVSKQTKCYRCGNNHLATQCTLYREIRCSGCGEKGHLRKVCFKAKEQTNQLEEILQL